MTVESPCSTLCPVQFDCRSYVGFGVREMADATAHERSHGGEICLDDRLGQSRRRDFAQVQGPKAVPSKKGLEDRIVSVDVEVAPQVLRRLARQQGVRGTNADRRQLGSEGVHCRGRRG